MLFSFIRLWMVRSSMGFDGNGQYSESISGVPSETEDCTICALINGGGIS